MGIAYNTSIVRNGLILHLDAANPKSYPGTGTAWNDLSGQNNHGVIYNSPSYNGSSFTFTNASQQYVDIPYKSEWRLIGSNTISFWSNGYDATANQTAVGYQKGSWQGYMMTSSGIAYSGTSGSNDTTPFITKSANEWCLFTWVIDRANGLYRTYKNNILSGTTTITQPDLSSSFSSGSLLIGASVVSSTRFFTGSISSVQFYTKALSAIEVQQNFEALRGRYGI